MSVYLILSHHNNILSCRVLHKNIVCTFCGPGFNISYPYFPIQHILLPCTQMVGLTGIPCHLLVQCILSPMSLAVGPLYKVESPRPLASKPPIPY